MTKLRCPCCGQMIEVQGASATCLGEGEETEHLPKEGEFFDKVLHPPALAQQAAKQERERFKQEFGELPQGSAEEEENSKKVLFVQPNGTIPGLEEPTYERDAKGKPITDISKLISDALPEDEEEEEHENH